MVRIEALSIPSVKVLAPEKHGDHRGFFSEVYSRRALAEAGIDVTFVQDNHFMSARKGTVRGLHFQTPPFAQDKLVCVARVPIMGPDPLRSRPFGYPARQPGARSRHLSSPAPPDR